MEIEKERERRRKKRGGHKFGIISTGNIWKQVLERAICSDSPGMLGASPKARVIFGGVETLGKDAGELHPSCPSLGLEADVGADVGAGAGAEVGENQNRNDKESNDHEPSPAETPTTESLVRAATRRLLRADRDISVIVLGCAGMIGMGDWVRESMEEMEENENEDEDEDEDEKASWRKIRVVDGVKAGIGILQGLCRVGGGV
jgi:hypothetical protein